MARRKLIWHLGLADAARPVIGANLEARRESLAESGVQVIATEDEARLATHELLRTHHQAGLRRAEVEGRWARVCDRVWQHKGVSVVSTPDLCLADKDQIRLALDPLIGVEVHLVVTADSLSQQLDGGWLAELRAGHSTGWEKYVDRVLAPTPAHRQAEHFWAGHDLPAMLSRWGWTFHADRLHVLACPDVGEQWRQFLDVAGVLPDGLEPRRSVVRRSGGCRRPPQGEPPAGEAARPRHHGPVDRRRRGGRGDADGADELTRSAGRDWTAALTGAGSRRAR